MMPMAGPYEVVRFSVLTHDGYRRWAEPLVVSLREVSKAISGSSMLGVISEG